MHIYTCYNVKFVTCLWHKVIWRSAKSNHDQHGWAWQVLSILLTTLRLLFNTMKPPKISFTWLGIFGRIVCMLAFSRIWGKVRQRRVSKHVVFARGRFNTDLRTRGFPQECIRRNFPLMTVWLRFYCLWINMHCRDKHLKILENYK